MEAKCQLCGEPMPTGEEMFNFHGYSGPCPKPPVAPKPVWGKEPPAEDGFYLAKCVRNDGMDFKTPYVVQVSTDCGDRYVEWIGDEESCEFAEFIGHGNVIGPRILPPN